MLVQDWKTLPTVDPKITEKYLRALPDVLDVHVWIERGELRAKILMSAGSSTSQQEVQEMCAYDLGWSYVPRRIRCEKAESDAAA